MTGEGAYESLPKLATFCAHISTFAAMRRGNSHQFVASVASREGTLVRVGSSPKLGIWRRTAKGGSLNPDRQAPRCRPGKEGSRCILGGIALVSCPWGHAGWARGSGRLRSPSEKSDSRVARRHHRWAKPSRPAHPRKGATGEEGQGTSDDEDQGRRGGGRGAVRLGGPRRAARHRG
jgi:hypothetical protein